MDCLMDKIEHPEIFYDKLGLSKHYKENPNQRGFGYADMICFTLIYLRESGLIDKVGCKEAMNKIYVPEVKEPIEKLSVSNYTPSYKPTQVSHVELLPEKVNAVFKKQKPKTEAGWIEKRSPCRCGGSGFLMEDGYIIGQCSCMKIN